MRKKSILELKDNWWFKNINKWNGGGIIVICGNNNKDEDNSLKTLNDKNHQASSQKFRQLKKSCQYLYDFLRFYEISN